MVRVSARLGLAIRTGGCSRCALTLTLTLALTLTLSLALALTLALTPPLDRWLLALRPLVFPTEAHGPAPLYEQVRASVG